MRDLIAEGRNLMEHWRVVVKPMNDALTATERTRHAAQMRQSQAARMRRWRTERPASYAENRAKVARDRKASRAGIESAVLVAADQRKRDLLASIGLACSYCGTVMPRCETVDHVIPVSRGGKHEPANLVPCCRRCNAEKGAKLVAAC